MLMVALAPHTTSAVSQAVVAQAAGCIFRMQTSHTWTLADFEYIRALGRGMYGKVGLYRELKSHVEVAIKVPCNDRARARSLYG
jgi:hypothetical protein